MTINEPYLRDLALDGVQLHGAHDAVLLGRDADQEQPRLLRIRAVVNNLAIIKRRMALEHLDGLRVALHRPVEDARLGDQRERVERDPLPEHNVLGHCVRLHLRLHLDVEDLQGFLRLQGDDFAGRVHDGRVGADGPPDRVRRVTHVDDDDLRGLADLLADADELVGLHRQVTEGDRRRLDADSRELK